MTAAPDLDLEKRIDQALAGHKFETADRLTRTYLDKAGPVVADDRDPARSSWFRARWLAAQANLAGGRLVEALQHAEPLRAAVHCVRLPQLACGLWLLLAEAQARLRQPEAAREALRQVLGSDLYSVARADPTLFLRVCRIRLWLGDVHQLNGDVVECDGALANTDDRANRALLWCEYGRAWDSAGDLGEAERCWSNALGLCPPGDSDPVRADVRLQLGRVARLRGELQSALDHYDEAEKASSETPALAEIRLRRLLVWLDLNQWGRARAAFDKLVPGGSVEALPPESRPLAETVAVVLGRRPHGEGAELQAFAALGRGDQEVARQLYRRALKQKLSPVRRARLALLLAQFSLDGDEKQQSLDEAEKLARQHNQPEVLWRALLERGTALAAQSDNDAEARSYFEEAVRIGERQARELKVATDAVAYRMHRDGPLRLLLRSAVLRGDVESVFRYQELDRSRLLFELYQQAKSRAGRFSPDGSPAQKNLDQRLAECDRRLAECERTLARADLPPGERGNDTALQLRQERHRLLEEFLADRGRRADSALPQLPSLAELQAVLPLGTVYVAPSRVEDEWYLLLARRNGAEARPMAAGADAVTAQTHRLRGVIERELRRGQPNGRLDMDDCLRDLGDGPIGDAIISALKPGERLLWVPEGELHYLPVAALRRRGRYLVERNEVVHGFSGALYVHQATYPPRSRRRWARSVVVAESSTVLPSALEEATGVTAALFRAQQLTGAAANRQRLRTLLAQARVAHFACHAYFDPAQALTAFVRLPSGEDWRTLEWLDEPVADLPLVTLSACRSAEVSPLLGREVFGLVTGVLAAGVRAVVAGLWPVSDVEAARFMWRFYRHRFTTDLATALVRTQRDAIGDANASPLFWGVFALYGDTHALPAPGLLGRWWGRLRQARHARRFPASKAPPPPATIDPW